MNADHDLDEVDSNRDSKKWSDAGQILEVPSASAAYGLDRTM